MNNKSSHSLVPAPGGVFHVIALRVKLIFRLMSDRRVNPWIKLIPIAGLIYWISPVDLIMGIPGLDAVDDVAVLWFAQYLFIELCPPAVVRELTVELSSGNNNFVDGKAGREEEIVDGVVTDVTEK